MECGDDMVADDEVRASHGGRRNQGLLWFFGASATLGVAAVTAIYEQMGLKQLTEKEIVAYSQKALEALDKVKMPDEAKQQFATFIQDLVGRDK